MPMNIGIQWPRAAHSDCLRDAAVQRVWLAAAKVEDVAIQVSTNNPSNILFSEWKHPAQVVESVQQQIGGGLCHDTCSGRGDGRARAAAPAALPRGAGRRRGRGCHFESVAAPLRLAWRR